MDNEKNPEAENFRQKTEKLQNEKSSEIISIRSETETLNLIHKIEVYQIELQIRAEALLLAQKQAEEAVEKYTELYNSAPLGYFSLSGKGEIIDYNHHGAQILGKYSHSLIGSRLGFFISDNT
jgi:PAS domain-containing protein